MNHHLLTLAMAQMYELRNRLANVNYPMANLLTLRDELLYFADSIHSRSVIGIQKKDLFHNCIDVNQISDFMTKMLGSANVVIPAEMKYVVLKMIDYWVPFQANNKVYVFTNGNYAVSHLKLDKLGLSRLESRCKRRFSNMPIFIYVPEQFSNDMITNVALFHEVGHIVEHRFSLATDILKDVLKEIIKSPGGKMMNNYFPNAIKSDGTLNEDIVRAYIEEYVADLFGAQYLGTYMLAYLEYLEFYDRHRLSEDHPSLFCRLKLVDSFMQCMSTSKHTTHDIFLDNIMNTFSRVIQKDLTLRNIHITNAKSNLESGSPINIGSLDELFSLFATSWEVITGGILKVENARSLAKGSLSKYDFYNHINTGLKATISNFMTNNP